MADEQAATTAIRAEISRLVAELVAASRSPEPLGERLLRWPELHEKVPYCHSAIYKLMAEGKFPKARSLGGGRAVGWSEREVNEWIQSREIAAAPKPAYLTRRKRKGAKSESSANEGHLTRARDGAETVSGP